MIYISPLFVWHFELYLGNIESICNRQMYKCDKCMKRFSRRDHLRTHEKNIHGEDVGPFICTVCSQLYKNSESLRKHFAKFHIHKVNELCNVDKNAVEKWNQNYSLYWYRCWSLVIQTLSVVVLVSIVKGKNNAVLYWDCMCIAVLYYSTGNLFLITNSGFILNCKKNAQY